MSFFNTFYLQIVLSVFFSHHQNNRIFIKYYIYIYIYNFINILLFLWCEKNPDNTICKLKVLQKLISVKKSTDF